MIRLVNILNVFICNVLKLHIYIYDDHSYLTVNKVAPRFFWCHVTIFSSIS